MKTIKYTIFLFGILFLLAACSKDEDPQPAVKGNQVGLFAEDARPITVPEAMLESNDPYAMQANLYLTLSTVFTSYAQYFEVPEGATKRSQPITATNAKMAASGYTVWEWVAMDGSAIAYQYSEQGGQQVFEIFIREGSKDYYKWYEVKQNLDGKKGTLKLFGDQGVAMQWTWEIKADESYHLNYDTDYFKYEIISNKDLSGSIKLYEDSVLTQEMEWDKIGNGWWKEYEAGELIDSGEWTV